MPRPVRIEYAGARYHVVNRGNRRDQVFFSDCDYELFILKLEEYADLYDVVVYSYCLMPNHYHIFLQTKHANLGKFMQSLNTSFTLSMNYKYNKCGHLFQGRYKAQLVETKLYKNKLSRYIHLNPVKVKSLENASLVEFKKHLRRYKWSSYPYYLGVAKKPKWINTSFVLSSWGKTKEDRIKNHRAYVDKGLLSDNRDELSPDERRNIIGSETFRDMITRKYLMKSESDIDEREQPVLAKINTLSLDDIVHAVMEFHSLESTDLIVRRRGADKHSRRTAMYLAVVYCKKLNSLAQIGALFGVGINAVSSNTQRIKNELLSDKHARREMREIRNLIDEKHEC